MPVVNLAVLINLSIMKKKVFYGLSVLAFATLVTFNITFGLEKNSQSIIPSVEINNISQADAEGGYIHGCCTGNIYLCESQYWKFVDDVAANCNQDCSAINVIWLGC